MKLRFPLLIFAISHFLLHEQCNGADFLGSSSQSTSFSSQKQPDNCEPLKAMGCVHLEGKCASEHVTPEGVRVCLKYEHKYKCPLTSSYSQKGVKGLPTGYCLTGDCLKTTRSTNQNMLDALSKLEALNQIQKHMTKNPITIFTGDRLSCTTNFGGSFKPELWIKLN